MVKTEAKKQVIGWNEYQFNRLKAIEDKMLNCAKDLKVIADATLVVFVSTAADFLLAQHFAPAVLEHAF